MRGLILLLAVLTEFAVASVDLGADEPLAWPRFRGPNGSGIAEDQTPPVEFGPDKNVKWKVEVLSGLSSPIVAGENLVITAFDDGKLYTIAYNRADGQEAWRREAPATQIERYYEIAGSPAASTSATDGEWIVSYFGSCGLVCYDLAGKEVWKYEMPTAVVPGNFGSGVSPILADGKVILVRDESGEPKIVAINAETGKLKWEKKRQSPVSYCTPVVWDTPDGKQLVSAGHGRMVGYDLESGAEKWFVAGMPSGCCPSPVTAGGNLFFAGWSPGGPDDQESQMPSFDAMLKDLDKDGDEALSREEVAETEMKDFFDPQDANQDGKITRKEWDLVINFMAEGENSAFDLKPGISGEVADSQLLWKETKGMPYIPSAIVYRGRYVMIKDGGIVTAYDEKSGDRVYMKRPAPSGSYYASPVAANGHIYFTSLNNGAVTVLKAGTDKPEVAAKNPELGERVASTPAIADNTLFIRTDKHMYAFAEEK